MEITQTLESITIVTDDCDLYLNLIYKIRQSFANVIGTRDRIIIFYSENELIQRKYLLKFIANLYRKTVGSGVEFWLTHHKNIKLIYKNPTSLQVLIDIDIKFEDNSYHKIYKKSLDDVIEKLKSKDEIQLDDDLTEFESIEESTED